MIKEDIDNIIEDIETYEWRDEDGDCVILVSRVKEILEKYLK